MLYFRFFFLFVFTSFLSLSAFAEIKVMECGSDYNAGVNHFSGHFNGTTTSNESVFAALKSDGTLVVWGPLNKGGQDPITGETSAPIGEKIKQVYANGRAFAAITTSGHIKSWGDTNFGGNTGINYAGAPSDSGYITIVSSSKAFAAIKNDGSVVSWGNPVYGGEGAPVDKGYVALFSSGSGFAALKADGSIRSWGGQKNAPGGTGFVSIYANANAFSAITADGKIVSWGSSQYGGGKAPSRSGFVTVASSDDGFVALHKDGSIAVWGSEFHKSQDWPDKYIDAPTEGAFKAVYANERAFAAITQDGSVVTWGHEKLGGSGGPVDKGYKYIVATAQSFVAVKEDGSVFGWGGIYGESDGVPVSSMKFVSVVASYYGYAGLQSDGRILVWGGTDDSHPETYGRPPNGTGFVAIISNDRAFAAIKDDGSVVSWGHDLSGGVDAPKDKGYVSINGVGANTKTDCRFILGANGGTTTPLPDSTPPVITLNGSNPVTVIKGTRYTDAGATANDDRDGNVTVTTSGSVDINSVGSYTLTYSATDKAGNVSTKTRTVNVQLGADTIKPVIKLNGAATVTIDKGSTYTDEGATANDDRDGNLTVVTTGKVDTNKPGTYTLTYSATDNAGNNATVKRTVIVRALNTTDTTKPVITINGATKVTIDKGSTYTDEGATANDDRDGDLTVIMTGNVDTNKPGTYILTYSATDNAGNTASVKRTVIVKAVSSDVTKPVITLIGPASLTINKGVFYNDPGANAVDDQDGKIEVVKTGSININKVGTYVLTYKATDRAGNVAIKTRTIIIKERQETDNTPPVITLNGAAQIEIYIGTSYSDAGATAFDAHDGTVKVTKTGVVDTSKAGSNIITYSATDKAGNSSTEIRNVIVRVAPQGDSVKPEISLLGSEYMTINLGDVYREAGATATDNRDGELQVVITGTVDVTKAGTYTLTYTATDRSGNVATKTRVVTVQAETQPRPENQVDTISPTITLDGSEKITLKQGQSYTDPGVSAKDDRLGQIKIITTGKVDTDKAGTYTITYTAIDAAGNKASVVRTIVVEDTEKPVIRLNGDIHLRLTVGESYNEPGATASDNVDGTIDAVISGQVDTSKIGTYVITYRATDQAGNTAELTRTVIVDAVSAGKSGGGSMGWMLILMMLAVSYLRKTVNRQ